MKLWKAIAITPAMLLAVTQFSGTAEAGFPKIPKVEVPKVTTDPSEAWGQAMWKVNSLSQEGIPRTVPRCKPTIAVEWSWGILHVAPCSYPPFATA